MSSSDSNYVPNEHEDVDQYNPYAIPSEIIMSLSRMKILTDLAHLQYHPKQCHIKNPASLVTQNEIAIELSS